MSALGSLYPGAFCYAFIVMEASSATFCCRVLMRGCCSSDRSEDLHYSKPNSVPSQERISACITFNFVPGELVVP